MPKSVATKKSATRQARIEKLREKLHALEQETDKPTRIPKPPTSPRAIRLPDTWWAAIELAAKGLDISPNAMVAQLIQEAFNGDLPVAP